MDDQTAPTTCTSDADLPGQFTEHLQLLQAVPRLYVAHAWSGPDGKCLSFGLVRVANISTAIPTARAQALAFSLARVACYHAREFRIQRYLKEKRLDLLLNRKRGDGHIVQDVEIAGLLALNSGE